MTARTHDAFAFTSLVTVAAIYPPSEINLYTFFACIIGNIVGALIPDMDDQGNRLWDLMPAGNMFGKIFRRIFYKHRTISHSLLGMFIVYKFFEWLLPKILNPEFIDPTLLLYSIMIGFISHLVADGLTKDGVPLFFPFKPYIGFPPFEKLRVRTGSWVENFVVMPALGIYFIWFLSQYKDQINSLLEVITA